jgi:hypothetical protein
LEITDIGTNKCHTSVVSLNQCPCFQPNVNFKNVNLLITFFSIFKQVCNVCWFCRHMESWLKCMGLTQIAWISIHKKMLKLKHQELRWGTILLLLQMSWRMEILFTWFYVTSLYIAMDLLSMMNGVILNMKVTKYWVVFGTIVSLAKGVILLHTHCRMMHHLHMPILIWS